MNTGRKAQFYMDLKMFGLDLTKFWKLDPDPTSFQKPEPAESATLVSRMIAGAGAEGCFLIPFTLSMEVVGVKVIFFL